MRIDGMGRRGGEFATPARAALLEGTQEGDELVLLCCAEAVEIIGHGLRFAAVALDGVVESGSTPVVQQLRAGANAPKRRRAHFLSRFLASGLHDAVTGADVVEEEVAVRMDDLIAKRIGHDERSRGHCGARRRRGDRGNVAKVAADVME